jgi:hypothetical protein
MQMFTSTREEHRTRRYCADCVDTNKEVREDLAATHATRDLDVSSDLEKVNVDECQYLVEPAKR